MPQFTRSSNPKLYDTLSNVKSTSESIEAVDNNVYLITLPEPISIASFLLNLNLIKKDYNYGIAYIDILEEINTEHNRNFNAFAFYFEKQPDNAVSRIIDVSDAMYINFIEHPAYNINRTQNFDRFIDSPSVLAPVFPDQTEIFKNKSYLPLFPLDITSLTLTNINSIPENDIYEVRFGENKKAFMNLSDRLDIFSNSTNISAFNNSLKQRFFVDPLGMFGNEIKNVLPYLFVIPDQNLAANSSEETILSISEELYAIGSTEGQNGLTIATKSYQGNTAPLRYCTLRSKITGPDGGITGRYIKVSFDLYSTEKNTTSVTFTTSENDSNNPASTLYLNAGSLLPNCFLETNAIDASNKPTMVKVYIRDKQCDSNVSSVGLTLSKTIISTDIIEFKPNIIQISNTEEPTPHFASKKVANNSSLYLTTANFLNNFDPQFNISSSEIEDLFVVDYEYVETCESGLSISYGYSQESNLPGGQLLNDGSYIIFTVRIIWQ